MREQLTVGSLFAGIGGFDLGLERAGMRVIWQSEIDPYACAVLRKHWPTVPNLGDIRAIDPARIERPDVICGGFPCQPFSSAGVRTGKADDRYLWPEMLRVIRETKPAWVVGENVTHIDRVALEDCLSDLEACGYEVAPFEIPACAIGADHRRDRIWILGHANGNGKPSMSINAEMARDSTLQTDAERRVGPLRFHASGAWRPGQSLSGNVTGEPEDTAERVGANDGLPNRVDRLRCLGNAIVPQIAEIIGRAIIEAEG